MAGLIKENKGVKKDASNFDKLVKSLGGGKSKGRTGKAVTKKKAKFKKAK